MILDLDSPLREGYFMDEVYKRGGPCEKFTPRKMGTERTAERERRQITASRLEA